MKIKILPLLISISLLSGCSALMPQKSPINEICSNTYLNDSANLAKINNNKILKDTYNNSKIAKLLPGSDNGHAISVPIEGIVDVACKVTAVFDNKQHDDMFVVFRMSSNSFKPQAVRSILGMNPYVVSDKPMILDLFATNTKIEETNAELEKQKQAKSIKILEQKAKEIKRQALLAFERNYPKNKYPLKALFGCETSFGNAAPMAACMRISGGFIEVRNPDNQFLISFPGVINGRPLQEDEYFPLTKQFEINALHYSPYFLLSVKLFDRLNNNKLINEHKLVQGRNLILTY